MLQQTRVAAMLPLYSKFLTKFPDLETLAKAEEEEVLSAWQGLGYYTRARNIRKAAIYLTANFNGKFPKDLTEALKIPGIGPYTARAVLSIAYDFPVAVLDGNVKRVLSRFYQYEDNIIGSKADKFLQALADSFLNLDSPGDHNQAVMELGAMICLPENPKCLSCPLLGDCKTQISGKTDSIPKRMKENKQVQLFGEILWIGCKDEVLLIREVSPRFLKGMFVLPILIRTPDPKEEYAPSQDLLRLNSSFAFQTLPEKCKHTITHHKFEFQIKRTETTKEVLETKMNQFSRELQWKWVNVDELTSQFPSSIARKVKMVMEK